MDTEQPKSDSAYTSALAGEGATDAMPDAHLTKFSARIKYTTGYGSTCECDMKSGTGTPNEVLLATLAELARIAAVAGLERQAREAAEGSFKAVAEWLAESQQ
jgi:hypothetical protein